MEMTPQRGAYTSAYIREVFGSQDNHLAGIMHDAVEQGLPDIAISADVGRLLMLITSMTRGKLAIEIGTLAGYSGIWIARGLRAESRLITVECDPHHAEFARQQFEKANVSDKVEVRIGKALDVLPRLNQELPPGSVDVIFLDALKSEYPAYWEQVRPLIAPGGVIMADNVLGSDWWIDDEDHPNRIAADRFSRLVANDPEFEAVAVPIREGVLIARRND